jgi:hypothetical protein
MSRWSLTVGFAVVLGWSLSASAVTPVAGTLPAYVSIAINTNGNNFDPHVAGDLATYTHDTTIHYHRFSTATDAEVPPGESLQDLLSDTDGQFVVFSRVLRDGTTGAFLYDPNTSTTAEIDAAPAVTRFSVVLGNGTLAYIDSGLGVGGELVIQDTATQISQQITSDSEIDAVPNVSPEGSVVVWEHCAVSYTSCDIWQAVKSGTSWTASVSSADPADEQLPDTNGSIVVYGSDRPSGAGDIFFRPVGGGAETEIELAGTQINPNVAGHYIAFESRNGGPGDIELYDVSTNKLYDVTSTPSVNEELDDVTMLANGDVRVIWDNDEASASARHVYAATIPLGGGTTNHPPTADAGSDFEAACTSPAGTPVTLEGSRSSDPDGDALTFAWSGPFGSASGASPTVSLPIGPTTVSLTVSDGSLTSAADTVQVIVTLGVEGLLSPLGMLYPESSVLPEPDKALKQGRTVPLKLRLSCGGTYLTDTQVAAPKIARLYRVGGADTDLAVVDLDAGAANDNGILFRYTTGGEWDYNLKTSSLGAGAYVITIEMPDGKRYDGEFMLR